MSGWEYAIRKPLEDWCYAETSLESLMATRAELIADGLTDRSYWRREPGGEWEPFRPDALSASVQPDRSPE